MDHWQQDTPRGVKTATNKGRIQLQVYLLAISEPRRSGHTTVLAWPLLAMRKLETKLELLTGYCETRLLHMSEVR
eukprot:3564194-Amphidinium_carterae.1